MTDLQQYWDESHVSYSQQNWIDKPSIFATEVKNYLPRSGKLLDLGAGQGQDSRHFAKNGFDVVAVDLSQHALDLAKEKSDNEGLSIDYQQLDFSEPLPFNNEEFDVVYSHLGLHYFCKDDTVKLFGEINRVLKKSGVFATLLNTIIDPELQEYGYEEVEPHYFKHLESGVCKSYFSPEYVKEISKGLLKVVLLDEEGKSYKDKNKNLIRFIGKKE